MHWTCKRWFVQYSSPVSILELSANTLCNIFWRSSLEIHGKELYPHCVGTTTSRKFHRRPRNHCSMLTPEYLHDRLGLISCYQILVSSNILPKDYSTNIAPSALVGTSHAWSAWPTSDLSHGTVVKKSSREQSSMERQSAICFQVAHSSMRTMQAGPTSMTHKIDTVQRRRKRGCLPTKHYQWCVCRGWFWIVTPGWWYGSLLQYFSCTDTRQTKSWWPGTNVALSLLFQGATNEHKFVNGIDARKSSMMSMHSVIFALLGVSFFLATPSIAQIHNQTQTLPPLSSGRTDLQGWDIPIWWRKYRLQFGRLTLALEFIFEFAPSLVDFVGQFDNGSPLLNYP